MQVEHLKATDCKELVAFLDEVFTLQNGYPMDFAGILPRILQENDENMGWYCAVKEDGKIVGTAAGHPLTYRIGEETLKVSSVGNVAVSPAYRNRGIMQMVVHGVNGDMDAAGVDLACLHGDRKRYRTFGYERCGVEYLVYIKQSMLKAEGCTADVSLEEITENSDLDAILALSSGQFSGWVYTRRELLSALKAHHRIPLAISRNGELLGYLSLSVKDGMIGELVLKNPEDFGSVAAAAAQYANNAPIVAIRLPTYEAELVRRALALCGYYQVMQPGNFRIVNPQKVLRVFLQAKGTYAPLADGALTIETQAFGSWTITCQTGKVSVVPAMCPADVVLPGYTAYPFLFGPGDPLLTAGVTVPVEKAQLVSNWFPMPLYCPHLV